MKVTDQVKIIEWEIWEISTYPSTKHITTHTDTFYLENKQNNFIWTGQYKCDIDNGVHVDILNLLNPLTQVIK
ncbi:hypothetical protein Glove_48g86 [Diversispora epigaea]|uniref:Uncharacterized protein n=1 Tax=Diversispora epigaea TaxID=1348612 RepID=A0A397JP15_9GLOM|nr:hypothetical protein Glove_48g86 [Diversispora epigaea]